MSRDVFGVSWPPVGGKIDESGGNERRPSFHVIAGINGQVKLLGRLRSTDEPGLEIRRYDSLGKRISDWYEWSKDIIKGREDSKLMPFLATQGLRDAQIQESTEQVKLKLDMEGRGMTVEFALLELNMPRARSGMSTPVAGYLKTAQASLKQYNEKARQGGEPQFAFGGVVAAAHFADLSYSDPKVVQKVPELAGNYVILAPATQTTDRNPVELSKTNQWDRPLLTVSADMIPENVQVYVLLVRIPDSESTAKITRTAA